MIKRNVLVRLTRLGMAMYAMFWCMSFTVCASDHPLADMAVQGSVTMLSESPETNETEDLSPTDAAGDPDQTGDEDLLPVGEDESALPEGADAEAAEAENEGVGEDDLLPEGGDTSVTPKEEKDEAPMVEAAEPEVSLPSQIRLKITSGSEIQDGTNITVINNGTYDIEVICEAPSDYELFDDKVTWELTRNGESFNPAEIEGLNWMHSGVASRLVFDWFNDTATFKVKAMYSLEYEDGEGIHNQDQYIAAECIFKVNPISYSYDVTALSFGDFAPPGGYINITSVEQNVTLAVSDPDNSSAVLDPECMEWGIAEYNATEYNILNNSCANITLDVNGTTAHINLTNTSRNCKFKVVARYNNNNSEQDPVTAAMPVVVDVFTETGEISGIVLNMTAIPIYDTSVKYQLGVSPIEIGSELDESRLEFKVFDYEGNEGVRGVSYTQDGSSCEIDVSELRDTSIINITASYTNASDYTFNASCIAKLIVSEITFGVDIEGVTAPDSQEITIDKGGEKISFWVVPRTPSGVSLNMSQISWVLNGSAFNSSSFDGESWIDSGDPAHAVVKFNAPKARDKVLVTAKYNNSFNDANDDPVSLDGECVQAHCMIHVEPATPDNVTGIKTNPTNLTITDPSKEYYINVLSSTKQGKIDPDRLVYSLLDKNREPVSSITGVSYSHITGNTSCVVYISEITDASSDFFIDAKYTNSSGVVMNITVPVAVRFVSNELGLEVMPSGAAGKNGNICNIIGNDGKIKCEVYSVSPYYETLGEEKLTWSLLENGQAVDPETRGIVFRHSGNASEITINPDVFNKTGTFRLVALYNNSYIDAAGKAVNPKNVNATCDIIIDTRPVSDCVEAHFPDSSVTVQIYNALNEIPFVIRYSEAGRGCPSDDQMYFRRSAMLIGATPADQKILDYFDVALPGHNRSITISLKRAAVQNSSIIAEITKKKSVKASLKVGVSFDDGEIYTDYTTENITISFGAAKPAVKVLKALEFDSYYAGIEKQYVSFSGASVGYFAFADEKAANKSGLCVSEDGRYINSTVAIPRTSGKKTLKVVAFIQDSNYNLPEGYNVTVPVSYIIRNSAPGVRLSSTSFTMNTFTHDNHTVLFNLTDDESYTDISYRIRDSKGNMLTPDNMSVTVTMTGDESGYIVLRPATGTLPGQTYKVEIFARNRRSGMEGPAKTITVKTVDSKNSRNISTSVKSKGTLDACLYKSQLTLNISGKNIDVNGKLYESRKILLYGTDEPITDYFTIATDSRTTDVFYITEKVPFSLLKAGYAGQKATFVLDYGEVLSGSEKHLIANYTFKIGKGTVTPKLSASSASYNPELNSNNISAFITNLYGNAYAYNVVMSCGKITAPFESEVIYNSTTGLDQLNIEPIISGLSQVYGKTVTVKITPYAPFDPSNQNDVNVTLPARAASFKINVLNPKKAKASIAVKTKGSIDSIRDSSNATINFSYKNLYNPDAVVTSVNCVEIFQQTKSGNITCDGFRTTRRDNSIVIRRNSGYSLAAGTYKALIVANVKVGDESRSLSSVATFKVTRGGKTGLSVFISSGTKKLTNRAYSRAINLNATRNSNVNRIRRISLGGNGKFNNTFEVNQISSAIPWYVRMSIVEGYIESTRGKPITKAVTKTVPLEIYYEGSDVPDKVNIKITINP